MRLFLNKMIDKPTLFTIFAETEKKLTLPLVSRDLTKKIIPYLKYKEIIAITGVRRCGKTYLMYTLIQHLIKEQIPKQNILYLNFEDERLAFIEPQDLETLYQWFLEYHEPKGKIYFFLDEIQNVPLWEKWLSRSYEKIKFIISGSNSTLLSSELSTALTGRHIELNLYPFSFKEYLQFKNIPFHDKNFINTTEGKAKLSKNLQEYLKKGGFPESLLFNKQDLLPQYYKDILLRDIIYRYTIKNKEALEKLSLFLLSNIAKPVSLYSLDKTYNVGINTIKNYINIIEKSFLIFLIPKFDYSLKKQQMNPRKLYAIDLALAKSVGFNFTSDLGRNYENLTYLELKRNNKEIYYHKDKYECDFIIKEGLNIIQAIQVCTILTSENYEREFNALLETLEKYNLKEGLIITENTTKEETIKNKKITFIPLWKWLITEQ